MKREWDEITPRQAAKVRNSPERLAFTRWLHQTLKPGDLVHGFLMSSSTHGAMHEFSHFVEHPECDFCAVAANGEELVLTTVAYVNGERVLNNPYIKWTRLNDKAREATMRISGFTALMEKTGSPSRVTEDLKAAYRKWMAEPNRPQFVKS